MTCEEVRELLPEHLLGSLDETADARVRRHLRGCGECRAEQLRLEDGVAALSHATHEAPTPDALRARVLDVLNEEWVEPGGQPASAGLPTPTGGLRWFALAAAAILIVISVGWGVTQVRRADRLEADASSYQTLLATLGGKEFRVGTMQPMTEQGITGTVVLYDGDPAQDWSSWGIVLAKTPGDLKDARAMLVGADGAWRELPALHFEHGEAATWLVTRDALTGFDELVVTSHDGEVLAKADIDPA